MALRCWHIPCSVCPNSGSFRSFSEFSFLSTVLFSEDLSRDADLNLSWDLVLLTHRQFGLGCTQMMKSGLGSSFSCLWDDLPRLGWVVSADDVDEEVWDDLDNLLDSGLDDDDVLMTGGTGLNDCLIFGSCFVLFINFCWGFFICGLSWKDIN